MNHGSSKNVGLIHYTIKSLSINHPYSDMISLYLPLRIVDYTPVKDLLRGNCPTLLVVRSNCRSPQRSQSAQNTRHDCGVLQLLFSNWVRWMILIGIATNKRKCPARALCVATGQLALAGPRLSQVWVGGPVAPNLRFIRRLSPSTSRCCFVCFHIMDGSV